MVDGVVEADNDDVIKRVVGLVEIISKAAAEAYDEDGFSSGKGAINVLCISITTENINNDHITDTFAFFDFYPKTQTCSELRTYQFENLESRLFDELIAYVLSLFVRDSEKCYPIRFISKMLLTLMLIVLFESLSAATLAIAVVSFAIYLYSQSPVANTGKLRSTQKRSELITTHAYDKRKLLECEGDSDLEMDIV
ncbi:hypothetical protein GQX74_009283 [Glossina fuscipes]|nr:hypothetical protein GQX74_009283 [Glossina fuscipes]